MENQISKMALKDKIARVLTIIYFIGYVAVWVLSLVLALPTKWNNHEIDWHWIIVFIIFTIGATIYQALKMDDSLNMRWEKWS